jgi:hypothetical protein
MRPSLRLPVGTALLLASVGLQAQAPTFSGDVQVWYNQALSNNLRANDANVIPTTKSKYYNLRADFLENGLSLRRVELKLAGDVVNNVSYTVMIDPTIASSATNPLILQDAFITWKQGHGFELKAGQQKNMQTYEAYNVGSPELLVIERSQLARMFGDKRDRGVVETYTFGDPKQLEGKASVGVFNGTQDLSAGKTINANAQQDLMARLEFTYKSFHKFGVYTLQGATDVADNTGLAIAAKPAGWPTQDAILANKDKTTNLGAFYVYQDATWHFSGEVLTGLLGRRFPTLGVVAVTTPVTYPAVKREYLDQKYLGYVATGAYTTGHHTFVLRYDFFNFNSGDQWYTAYNPYTTSATGPLGADYTPKYTETTAGYQYAFTPKKWKAAKLEVNYIARSKNFLKPRAGQTGEQGGDSLVAAFVIAF